MLARRESDVAVALLSIVVEVEDLTAIDIEDGRTPLVRLGKGKFVSVQPGPQSDEQLAVAIGEVEVVTFEGTEGHGV